VGVAEVDKSNPRLIVVDSNRERRGRLVEAMKIGDFDVTEAASGAELFRLLTKQSPVAVVLGWPLRGSHGQSDLLRHLRDLDWRMLIAVLGVAAEAIEVRYVLEAGADLCFPSDYDLDALAVHVELGLRLRGSASGRRMHVGDLTIDMDIRQVWRAEVALSLTPIEFRLLASLMREAGHVVSKTTLLEECWRRHDDTRHGGGHLVEVHIAALRQKLHACGPPVLRTVRGHGFVLQPGE
jgi:two-component system OmpR family response regulator